MSSEDTWSSEQFANEPESATSSSTPSSDSKKGKGKKAVKKVKKKSLMGWIKKNWYFILIAVLVIGVGLAFLLGKKKGEAAGADMMNEFGAGDLSEA
jgi:hypothetical protein